MALILQVGCVVLEPLHLRAYASASNFVVVQSDDGTASSSIVEKNETTTRTTYTLNRTKVKLLL